MNHATAFGKVKNVQVQPANGSAVIRRHISSIEGCGSFVAYGAELESLRRTFEGIVAAGRPAVVFDRRGHGRQVHPLAATTDKSLTRSLGADHPWDVRIDVFDGASTGVWTVEQMPDGGSGRIYSFGVAGLPDRFTPMPDVAGMNWQSIASRGGRRVVSYGEHRDIADRSLSQQSGAGSALIGVTVHLAETAQPPAV